MRVWALASCGGLFMLTTYIAFRHDANAQKANDDILLGGYETDQDDQSLPEVTHLQAISLPEVQRQPSPSNIPSTNSSLSKVQSQPAPTSTYPWNQSVHVPGRLIPPSNSVVLGSSPELSSVEAKTSESTEETLAVSQDLTNTSADTDLAPGTPIDAESNYSEADNVLATTEVESQQGDSRITVTAEPVSINPSSDVMRPAALATVTAPSVNLPQTPQFSSTRPSIADSSQRPESSTSSSTASLDSRRSSNKPVVQKPLERLFYPRLSSRRQLTTQPRAFTPMAEGWTTSMKVNL